MSGEISNGLRANNLSTDLHCFMHLMDDLRDKVLNYPNSETTAALVCLLADHAEQLSSAADALSWSVKDDERRAA